MIMELVRLFVIPIAILTSFGITMWILNKAKQYRVNLYKLGGFMSRKLGNSDESLGNTLPNIYICNKSLEGEKVNGYKNGKL